MNSPVLIELQECVSFCLVLHAASEASLAKSKKGMKSTETEIEWLLLGWLSSRYSI